MKKEIESIDDIFKSIRDAKEKILDKCFPDLIEYPHYDMNDFQKNVCYEAMDIHAKQDAIEFWKFCIKNNYKLTLAANEIYELYQKTKHTTL